VNLILVLLQINQPPTADTHHEHGQDATKEAANDRSAPASTTHDYPDTGTGTEH